MPVSLAPARRAIALHEAVEVAWQVRRYSMVWLFCWMLISTGAAIAFTPKYVSNATLLLLLGPEYTVRATADEPNSSTNAMDADHITASETAILASEDLHRQVLREAGLEEVYPDYVHPGLVTIWINAAKARIKGFFVGDGPGDAEIDPVEWALIEFDAHLSLVASRQGNVITASFSHANPATARKVLAFLVKDYFAFRRGLYSNEQAAILASQAQNARIRLDAASQQLADFLVQSGVADFGARLGILQHQQGDAEKDRGEAVSQIAQQQARVAVLSTHLAALHPTTAGGTDTELNERLTPLRATLDALRGKIAEARAHVRSGSPLVQGLEEELRQREGELGAGRADTVISTSHTVLNTVYQNAQYDLIKARTDLAAAQAGEAAIRQQLVTLASQIEGLQIARRRQEDLQRQRDVFDDSYRATAKLLEARHNSEQVDARKLPSVRMAQAPDYPLKPKPTRLIILVLGLFVSGAGAVGIPLLVNLCRRSYVLRESVEYELAMPVLACIPAAMDRIGQRHYAADLAR